jgi:hypothetical protein
MHPTRNPRLLRPPAPRLLLPPPRTPRRTLLSPTCIHFGSRPCATTPTSTWSHSPSTASNTAPSGAPQALAAVSTHPTYNRPSTTRPSRSNSIWPKKSTPAAWPAPSLTHPPLPSSCRPSVPYQRRDLTSSAAFTTSPIRKVTQSMTTSHTIRLLRDPVCLVRRLCPNSLFAKIDVKAAFRCVPVHPTDRWLLCMKWQCAFYADLALPFGLKSSPGIWERYSSLAEWILRRNGVLHIIHYFDDFLLGCAPASSECTDAITITLLIFEELGIPSAEKLLLECTPPTLVTFLCILIDTSRMQTRLDPQCLISIGGALLSLNGTASHSSPTPSDPHPAHSCRTTHPPANSPTPATLASALFGRTNGCTASGPKPSCARHNKRLNMPYLELLAVAIALAT